MLRMIQLQIDQIDEQTRKIIAKGKAMPTVKPINLPTSRPPAVLDEEVARLSRIVNSCYMECVKKPGELTALMMLEQLELGMYSMSQSMIKIPPKFVAEKQAAMERARREENRAEKLKQQLLEQQNKAILALKRASKPAKRRIGRPTIERSRLRPVQHQKVVKRGYEGPSDEVLYGDLNDPASF
jgi:hypothetical protein